MVCKYATAHSAGGLNTTKQASVASDWSEDIKWYLSETEAVGASVIGIGWQGRIDPTYRASWQS